MEGGLGKGRENRVIKPRKEGREGREEIVRRERGVDMKGWLRKGERKAERITGRGESWENGNGK